MNHFNENGIFLCPKCGNPTDGITITNFIEHMKKDPKYCTMCGSNIENYFKEILTRISR